MAIGLRESLPLDQTCICLVINRIERLLKRLEIETELERKLSPFDDHSTDSLLSFQSHLQFYYLLLRVLSAATPKPALVFLQYVITTINLIHQLVHTARPTFSYFHLSLILILFHTQLQILSSHLYSLHLLFIFNSFIYHFRTYYIARVTLTPIFSAHHYLIPNHIMK